MKKIKEMAMRRKTDEMPEDVRGDQRVAAFYNVVIQGLEESAPGRAGLRELAADTAHAIEHIQLLHRLTHWRNNDVLHGLDDDIKSFLIYAIEDLEGLPLPPEVVDVMVMQVLRIAGYEMAE